MLPLLRQYGNLFPLADPHLPDLQIVVEYFDHIQTPALQRAKDKLAVIICADTRNRLRFGRIAGIQNGDRILDGTAVLVNHGPADRGITCTCSPRSGRK